MRELTHVIVDPEGLHARNAAALACEARNWKSAVSVFSGAASCDASDLMGLMALDARTGDEMVLRIEGPDEDAGFAALSALLEESI